MHMGNFTPIELATGPALKLACHSVIFDKCILCEYVKMPKRLKMMLFYAFMGRSKIVC